MKIIFRIAIFAIFLLNINLIANNLSNKKKTSKLDSIVIPNKLKYVFTYDEFGNKTSEIQLIYANIDKYWFSYDSLKEYSFSSNEDTLQKVVSYMKEGTFLWEKKFKHEYKYNYKKLKVEEIVFNFNENINDWEYFSKIETKYNDTNKITLQLKYSWSKTLIIG